MYSESTGIEPVKRYGAARLGASELAAPALLTNSHIEAARLWEIFLTMIEDFRISDIAFVEGMIWVGISKHCHTLFPKGMISQELYLALIDVVTSTRPNVVAAIAKNSRCEQDFSCEMIRRSDGKRVRFRVNHFMVDRMPSIVMRPLPDKVPNYRDLGLSDHFIDRVTNIQNGIIPVAGTTNSGKSTTLAAILQAFNERHEYHIVTLEDPVEFRFVNEKCMFSQREIGEDTESFAAGLRAAMRQSPHIIVVGELRDYETIQAACEAALSGHIVFTTTHADGVSKSVTRLVDTAPPNKAEVLRKNLANSLKLMMYQVLPRLEDGTRTCLREILWVNEEAGTTIASGRDKTLNDYMRSHSEEGCVLFEQAYNEVRNTLHPDDAKLLKARFPDQNLD